MKIYFQKVISERHSCDSQKVCQRTTTTASSQICFRLLHASVDQHLNSFFPVCCSYLLAIISYLTSAGAECGTILARWLEDQFPRSHEQFSGSLQAAILDRLSLSIHFLFPFDRDTARHLNELRLWVENGPLVLNALTQIKPTHPEQEAEAPLDDDLPTFIQVKKSQRQRKVARSARKVRFDTKTLKALLDYGIDAMSIDSNFDASHEFQVVLNLQKRVLKVHLVSLSLGIF